MMRKHNLQFHKASWVAFPLTTLPEDTFISLSLSESESECDVYVPLVSWVLHIGVFLSRTEVNGAISTGSKCCVLRRRHTSSSGDLDYKDVTLC